MMLVFRYTKEVKALSCWGKRVMLRGHRKEGKGGGGRGVPYFISCVKVATVQHLRTPGEALMEVGREERGEGKEEGVHFFHGRTMRVIRVLAFGSTKIGDYRLGKRRRGGGGEEPYITCTRFWCRRLGGGVGWEVLGFDV